MTDNDTTLAAKVAQLANRVGNLEDELAEERAARKEAEQRVETLERTVDAHKARFDTKTGNLETAVAEMLSREFEKAAHFRFDTVSPFLEDLEVAEGRVEQFKKDGGYYARLPGAEDALQRGGGTQVAHSDLLPIQQLARLDDDMLASEARPVRLAVWAWNQMDDTGKYGSLWSKGSGDVDRYVDAGDLAEDIRAKETGVSREYAKKLASRTIDAMMDMSKSRCYVEMRNRRKDGLHYKERRFVVPSNAEIPGRSNAVADDSPETDGVAG